MASTIQLSELRTEVRRRGEYRSPYISDSELNSYINGSCAHLYNVFAEQDPSLYLTQGSISVVSGTESYSLPATFYKAVSVNIPYSTSPTGYISAQRIGWQERHAYSGGVASDKRTTRYAIRGGNIYFWPTPTWTDTVQLDFIPAYSKMSLDTDTFDGLSGWEEWAIADTLVKCASKADDDPTNWERQRALVERRLFASGDQDQAQPKTVKDVHGILDCRGRRYTRYPR